MFDAPSWSERLLGQNFTSVLEQLQAEGAVASCCTVQWRNNDIAFRCGDCEADSDCVVCTECFFGANHEGHSVSLIRTTGGCCDCGDPSSWKPEGFCSRHRGITEREDSASAIDALPDGVRERCLDILEEAVRFADMELARLSATADVDRGDAKELHSCLDWLRAMGEVSFGLRAALRTVLAPRLQAWIRHAASCKKTVMGELLLEFFIGAIQQSPRLKMAFAAECLVLYEELNEGQDESRLGALTVQLFRVPEVALALCREHRMVERVCLYFVRRAPAICRQRVTRRKDKSQFEMSGAAHDLRYVLCHDAVCDFVLRDATSRGAVLSLLRCMWRVNPQTRQVGNHVLYESTVWDFAFRIDEAVESALEPLESAARRLPWAAAELWYAELLAQFRDLLRDVAVGTDAGGGSDDVVEVSVGGPAETEDAEGDMRGPPGVAAGEDNPDEEVDEAGDDEDVGIAEETDGGGGGGVGEASAVETPPRGGSSFHTRLLRFLVQSLPLSSLLRAAVSFASGEGAAGAGADDAYDAGAWLRLFSPSDLRHMLRQAVEPYVLASEASVGLWVRNGHCMRLQAQRYSWRGWQEEDLLVVQVCLILLGMHRARRAADGQAAASEEAQEPLEALWEATLSGFPMTEALGPRAGLAAMMRASAAAGATADDSERASVRVECFWEILGRALNQAWLPDVTEARRRGAELPPPAGTPGDAASRALLRRMLVQLLAEKSASASEVERLMRSWHDHPARDDVLRAVANPKATDAGVIKFELKPESWQEYDALMVVDGQRSPPEVEEIALKQKCDMLGPARDARVPATQDAWRDLLLFALREAPLVAMVRDMARARGLAQRFAAVAAGGDGGGQTLGSGAWPWVLKVLDILHFGRSTGGGVCGGSGVDAPGRLAELTAALLRRPQATELVGAGSPVRVALATEGGMAAATSAPAGYFVGLLGFVAANRGDGGAEVAVFPEGGGDAVLVDFGRVELASHPATWREEIAAALQALHDTGVLAHLASRALERGASWLQQAGAADSAQAGGVGDDADAEQRQRAAKRRALAAARQKAMLESMAAKQQGFMAQAAAADDEQDAAGEAGGGGDVDAAGAWLQCDVCREPSSGSRVVCLLAHTCPSDSLRRLTAHPDFDVVAPAVSSCGHAMHEECFRRHKEHYQAQRDRYGMFSYSRVDQHCVPCPVCRAIVSVALPVLPPCGVFHDAADGATAPAAAAADSASADVPMAGPAPGASGLAAVWDAACAAVAAAPAAVAESALTRAAAHGGDAPGSLLDACALQLLTTSAITPARAVPAADGAPPLHAVMLRLLRLQHLMRSAGDGQGPAAAGPLLPAGANFAHRDLKRVLLEAIGRPGLTPASFLEAAVSLTELRARALSAPPPPPMDSRDSAGDDGPPPLPVDEEGVRRQNVEEGLAAWLVFVAWVASGLWTFESRDLNVLAHLPDAVDARLAALSQLLFRSTLDLGALIARGLSGGSPSALPAPSQRDTGGFVELAPLPVRLLDAIRRIYKRTCSRCGTVPKDPCMCLVCGDIVCVGDSSCGRSDEDGGDHAQLGSLGRHAGACAASQGLFLHPYYGNVIAISGPMVGLWEYPYVNSYGEAVEPIRSVSGLTLDSRRLDRLRAILTTGTVDLEILRHNQRTGRYIRDPL